MKNLCVLLFGLIAFLILSSCSPDLKTRLVGKWEVLESNSDSEDSLEYKLTKKFNYEVYDSLRLMGYKQFWEFHQNSNRLSYIDIDPNGVQRETNEKTYSIQGEGLFIDGKHAPYEFLNKNKTELIIKIEYISDSSERVRYYSYRLKK